MAEIVKRDLPITREEWPAAKAVEYFKSIGETYKAEWVDEIAKRGEAIKSEEHTSELQSLMRISYAVFCLKKKNNKTTLMIETALTYNYNETHKQTSQQ